MGKCARGWKRVGDSCRRVAQRAYNIVSPEKSRKIAVNVIILPFMFISFLLMFALPDFRVGFLYFAMSLYTLNAFTNGRYKEETYGFKLNLIAFVGVPIAIGFLLLSAISPAFSLLTPVIALSVALSLRYLIILIVSPWTEEPWRSATFGYLKEHYKNMPFWLQNIFQSIFFALLHTVAYGLFLNSFDKWIQVYGAFLAIAGAFLAAFVWGLISGYIMDKTKSFVPSGIAHSIINFWMIRQGLVVVS